MSALRLSICIATLNRAAYLGQTLECLVTQATEEVEIVIVDGASTDNTGEIVQRYAAHFPRLRYLRLEKKGGVDQDYAKATDLAQGDYIWLFTDDDLLKPGAVAAVLEAARKDYSLIIVNAEVRTPNLDVCLQPQRVIASEDRIYHATPPDRDRLMADAGSYLSFIGGIVMKRAVWNQRDREKYFGSLFIGIGMIFDSPLPGDTLVMAYPWIIIRYGNALWTSRSFEIWMFKFPNIVWGFRDIPDWAKRRVEAREPWQHYHRLLFERAKGHYSLKEYSAWLEPHIKSPLRKFVTRSIGLLPVAPLNWSARLLLRYVFRKAPSITLFDLEANRP